MNMSEADFIKKLRETFFQEAQEHLNTINSGLLQIEKEGMPADNDLIDTIFRQAHNLKGGARAVNQNILQDICQSLESVFSALRQKSIPLTPESFDLLFNTLNMIRQHLKQESENDIQADSEVRRIISQLEQLAKGKKVVEDEKPSNPELQKEPTQPAPPPIIKEELQVVPAAAPPKKEKLNQPKKKNGSEEIDKGSDSTVRVSTHKLDTLLRQIEEILVIKLTSKQRVAELHSILKDLQRWKKERKRVQKDLQLLRQWVNYPNHSQPPQHALDSMLELFNWEEDNFKKINDRIGKIAKQTDQDSRISGTIVDNLLEDTKTVLMQPINTLMEAFPMMVRDIAKQLGKKVLLEITGDDIEIDRRILEELKNPLIHLIRNSIDHGIELPEKRKLLGKPPAGVIKITITEMSGNSVNITISDDGQGVDIEGLKKSALKTKVATAGDIERLDDKNALMLMFHSGVTTSEIITDLSGRGLGVGIVSEKVEKLGGKIAIETEKNRGTTFKITIPITLATFRGVYISINGQDFIIPTNYLLRVLRLNSSSITTLEGREVIRFEDKHIPYVHLEKVLGLSKEKEKVERSNNTHILILKATELTVALGVDRVLKEQEVFIKGLGGQLSNIKNIAAATIVEWGKVIPILDPFDIARSSAFGYTPTTVSKKRSAPIEERKRTILVVEDTVTARMLLKNILDSAGYNVKTAVDGLEAFSILNQEPIDLLLSDIEMPRMDGFELTEKVRQSEKFTNLPIVLCTSLSSREDKERGIAVGANAYIIKSSFEQSNLLETIDKLI